MVSNRFGKYIHNITIIRGIGLRPIVCLNVMTLCMSLDKLKGTYFYTNVADALKSLNMCLRYFYDAIIDRLRKSGNHNIMTNYDFVFQLDMYRIGEKYMYNPNCGQIKTKLRYLGKDYNPYTLNKVITLINKINEIDKSNTITKNPNLTQNNIIKRYVSMMINIIIHFIDDSNIHGSHTRIISQDELVPSILSYTYDIDIDIIDIFDRTLEKLGNDTHLLENKHTKKRLLKGFDTIKGFVSSNDGLMILFENLSHRQKHHNLSILSKTEIIPNISEKYDTVIMINKIKNVCKNINDNITNTIIEYYQNKNPGLSDYILINVTPFVIYDLMQLLSLSI